MSLINVTLSRRGLQVFCWVLVHILVAVATALMVLAAIQAITLKNFGVATAIILIAQINLTPRLTWKKPNSQDGLEGD